MIAVNSFLPNRHALLTAGLAIVRDCADTLLKLRHFMLKILLV